MSEKVCKYWASGGSCLRGNSCHFLHPDKGSSGAAAQAGGEDLGGADAQPFIPSSAVAAPAFVPTAPSDSPTESTGKVGSADAGEFTPSQTQTAVVNPYEPAAGVAHNPYAVTGDMGMGVGVGVGSAEYGAQLPAELPGNPNTGPYGQTIETRGGTTYFVAGAEDGRQHLIPIQLNTYAGTLPHVAHLKANQRRVSGFAMDELLRQEYIKHNALILAHVDHEDPQFSEIPKTIAHFHTIFPLDNETERPNMHYGSPTYVYKAISSQDGLAYALRRIDGSQLSTDHAMSLAERWRHVKHPNVVSFHAVIATSKFSDNSLLFQYDYHPMAVTLEMAYLSQAIARTISEQVLWSYIVQIVCGLRAIHAAGLACRSVVASKILLSTHNNRVRLSGTAIFDVLNFDGGSSLQSHQQGDLIGLGKLVVALACGSAAAPHHMQQSLEFISVNYSTQLKNFVLLLLAPNKSMPYPTVDNVCDVLAPRIMNELDTAQTNNDLMEGELMKELENGRLFRLAAKLGFINERPESDMGNWSETDDRYILKLFRDYVFHQVTETGQPSVDFGHVVECLNKLDVGSEESVLLMSRDEQSLIVVTYAELKRAVESSFASLTVSSNRSRKPAREHTASVAGPSSHQQQQQQQQHHQPQQQVHHSNQQVHMPSQQQMHAQHHAQSMQQQGQQHGMGGPAAPPMGVPQGRARGGNRLHRGPPPMGQMPMMGMMRGGMPNANMGMGGPMNQGMMGRGVGRGGPRGYNPYA